MVHRFIDHDGHRLLVEALQQQVIVHGAQDLSMEIAKVVEVILCEQGQRLIEQGSSDNDLYFILSGRFNIQVNGRNVAVRIAGAHVGEMALIDPKARRSASAIALVDSVVAKISESNFSLLAANYPILWRNLARELGDRLRQRNDLIKEPNRVKRMFIASSIETLPVANEIQAGLKHDPVVVIVWTNKVFEASDFSLEALERAGEEADFAVLVFGPDDKLLSRGKELDVPRDNVVFELGLFIGAIGRRRVFIVLPQNSSIKIPTDLLGITPITYATGEMKDLAARIGPVCTELRRIVNERTPK
jgi:predicted nucleotide-binding protein